MAASFWFEVALPHPVPRIAPGWAITGKRAFLEVGMPLETKFEQATPLGPLLIDASASISVDWGDGTRTRAARTAGGPWPDGDLTHTWTSSGTVDVVVRAHWTARWTLGPYRGSLDRISTAATLERFVVREVQGLRTD